jgi:THO complex subunit 4
MSLVYDRQDRSTGVAYVVYYDTRDARTAVQEFDGANANGQPIKLTFVPNGPNKPRNPFDNVERPTRSLFDRVERRTGNISEEERPSRRTNTNRPPPDNVDRYVPGEGQGERERRSPRRDVRDSRGRGGRRPGQRRPREQRDADGHLIVQGRPRKTAEELDEEMSDYWGKKQDEAPENGKAVNPLDGDIDMDV